MTLPQKKILANPKEMRLALDRIEGLATNLQDAQDKIVQNQERFYQSFMNFLLISSVLFLPFGFVVYCKMGKSTWKKVIAITYGIIIVLPVYISIIFS